MSDQKAWQPIGVVHSEIKDKGAAPAQGPEKGTVARIELVRDWAPGLEGLAPGRWLWVLCYYHRGRTPRLRIHPRGDSSRPLTGLFNSRSPNRPNPISLTLVRLEALDDGVLTVSGLEALDGTPVLDIKPYSPNIDTPRQEEGE